MLRLVILAALLLGMAAIAPEADASELSQRHGHPGVSVGGNWHHGGGVGFRHPFGWGFRGPGFGLAPFLPVVALPPPVVAVPVGVPVPVDVPVPAYAPPAVNYAPALPATAPPCTCSAP